LGVRYVLEGSVRKGGNRVRITGQLIDTTTGAHIWADRFDGALATSSSFRIKWPRASSARSSQSSADQRSNGRRASRPNSLDAYDLYLRAIAQFHKYTEEGMREAVSLAENALCDRSVVCTGRGDDRLVPRPAENARLGRSLGGEIAQAVLLARQAIEAGRDEPDALSMAGSTISFLAGEHSRAGGAIDRALALNPNSALAWSGAAGSWLAEPARLGDRSAPASDTAQPPRFRSPIHRRAGSLFAHMEAGRYERAIEWGRSNIARAAAIHSPRCASSSFALRISAAPTTQNDWLEAGPCRSAGADNRRVEGVIASTVFSPENPCPLRRRPAQGRRA